MRRSSAKTQTMRRQGDQVFRPPATSNELATLFPRTPSTRGAHPLQFVRQTLVREGRVRYLCRPAKSVVTAITRRFINASAHLLVSSWQTRKIRQAVCA